MFTWEGTSLEFQKWNIPILAYSKFLEIPGYSTWNFLVLINQVYCVHSYCNGISRVLQALRKSVSFMKWFWNGVQKTAVHKDTDRKESKVCTCGCSGPFKRMTHPSILHTHIWRCTRKNQRGVWVLAAYTRRLLSHQHYLFLYVRTYTIAMAPMTIVVRAV